MDSPVPVVVIVLSIPLILGIVPPNYLYGFRIPRTMASADAWYPANRVSGIAMALAGLIWVTSDLLAPSAADGTVRAIGWTALAAALAFSFWWVYRKR